MADELLPEGAPADPVAPETTETAPPAEPEGEAYSATDSAAPADPYAEYGGADAVKAAVEYHKALQTEDGVWNTFFQTGRALGLGVREIEALFNSQGGEVAPEPQGPADDDVMTYAEFKRMLEEQVLKPQQEQQRVQAEQVAHQTINSTIKELGVESQEIREAILQLGDRYLGNDISPANVAAAVKKGHADYLKLVEAERKKYLGEKREQQSTVPQAPRGGSLSSAAAAPTEDEPKSVAEAIRRSRARRAAQG
jgi:hypothetical protein